MLLGRTFLIPVGDCRILDPGTWRAHSHDPLDMSSQARRRSGEVSGSKFSYCAFFGSPETIHSEVFTGCVDCQAPPCCDVTFPRQNTCDTAGSNFGHLNAVVNNSRFLTSNYISIIQKISSISSISSIYISHHIPSSLLSLDPNISPRDNCTHHHRHAHHHLTHLNPSQKYTRNQQITAINHNPLH